MTPVSSSTIARARETLPRRVRAVEGDGPRISAPLDVVALRAQVDDPGGTILALEVDADDGRMLAAPACVGTFLALAGENPQVRQLGVRVLVVVLATAGVEVPAHVAGPAWFWHVSLPSGLRLVKSCKTEDRLSNPARTTPLKGPPLHADRL